MLDEKGLEVAAAALAKALLYLTPFDELREEQKDTIRYKANATILAYEAAKAQSTGEEEVQEKLLDLPKVADCLDERAGYATLDAKIIRQTVDLLVRLSTRLRQAEADALKEGWRPIETAPKDGTVVDLWCTYPKRRLVNYLWDGECWRENLDPVMYPSAGRINSGCEHVISHWMPLPPPPSRNEAVTEGQEQSSAPTISGQR